VDSLEVLVLNVTEAVSLVPTSREDIERDLATDRVGQAIVGELVLESRDKLFTQLVLQIELLEVVTLRVAAVTSNGRDVDHSVTELDERSTI